MGTAVGDWLAHRPLLLGVVHLVPLPGAPAWTGSPRWPPAWRERALRDAQTLVKAGFDGVLVENHGDAPYFARRVPPETVAAMAVVLAALRDALPARVALGANVLRNDARAAVALAAAARLDFVRVNVLAGAYLTDQGLVEGEAARVQRDRARLAPSLRVLADLRVKHAAPLVPRPLEEEALDLVERARADAVVLTGARTGEPVDAEALLLVREALPQAVLLVGSGARTDTVGDLMAVADGVIVGTALKRAGRLGQPVDARRAAAFVRAAATGTTRRRGRRGR